MITFATDVNHNKKYHNNFNPHDGYYFYDDNYDPLGLYSIHIIAHRFSVLLGNNEEIIKEKDSRSKTKNT